ncbi:MAG: FHA domain-containing protein, partial [Myxococcales bacterium]|nr:FHA domain-containing protein [Myxococcales bacterium]
MSDRPRPGGFAAAPPKAGEGARPGAADEESTDKVDALPDASVEESPTIDSPHPIQQVPTAFVMPAVRVPARPVIIGPPPSSQPPLPSTPPPSWPQPPPTDDELTAPTELPRGRLRVDEGEQKGRTFYLNQDETRIGRANENDVVLLDIGVSRRHLRIDRHDAGFRLYDLDSGNGTYVNGRRIIEAELFDDDTIEAGSTVMVFGTVGKPRLRSEAGETDPGAAVPAHRRGLPVSWLILMALVTFVSVLSTMYLVRTLRAPTARPIAEPATSFLDRARTAIEARQWGEARGHLDVARALGEAPEAAEALRAQVEREARNAEQLA